MHLFYKAFNRKSYPINKQIMDAIDASKSKILDCQQRLNSDEGIKGMLINDLKRADDQIQTEYFQKQIIGIQRSIRIRKRRIKKYQSDITELEDAMKQVKQKG